MVESIDALVARAHALKDSIDTPSGDTVGLRGSTDDTAQMFAALTHDAAAQTLSRAGGYLEHASRRCKRP